MARRRRETKAVKCRRLSENFAFSSRNRELRHAYQTYHDARNAGCRWPQQPSARRKLASVERRLGLGPALR